MQTLLLVAFALFAGLLMTRLFIKFHLPDVTAYLVAGVLIGPCVLGQLQLKGIGFSSFEQVESLSLISGSYVLDISSLDILNAAVERVTDSRAVQDALVKCVGEKNPHGILAICQDNGIDEALAE